MKCKGRNKPTLYDGSSTCSDFQIPFWKLRNITAYYVPTYPALIMRPDGNPGGVDGDLIRIFEQYLKTDIVLKRAKGFPHLAKLAITNRADIALSQPNLFWSRCQIVQCSWMMFKREGTFVVLKPKPIDNFGTLAYPFGFYVWMSLVVISVLVIIVLTFLDPLWIISGANGKTDFAGKAIDIVLASILQESISHSYYKVNGSRFVLLFIWMLGALVISHAYRSTLLSTLVIITYESEINTLEQMLEKDMTMYVVQGTYIHQIMESPNIEPKLQEAYQKLCKDKDGVYPFGGSIPKHILGDLFSGRAVLAGPKDFVPNLGPKIRMTTFTLYSANTGWIFGGKKKTELWDVHQGFVMRMSESGILQHSFNKHYNSKLITEEAATTRQDNVLLLRQISPVNFMLVAGLFISFVSFIIELRKSRKFSSRTHDLELS